MPTIIIANNTDHLKELVTQAMATHGPLCDLNHIDVSGLDDFYHIFKNTDFNGDISRWDMSNATTLKSMFENCPFNGDISRWKVLNVTTFTRMFAGSAFNGDISAWNTSRATKMDAMFHKSAFNGDISRWEVSQANDCTSMFQDCPFSGDVSNWRTTSLRQATNMFSCSAFNGDVSRWDIAELRSARYMFCTSSFQQDLGNWVLEFPDTFVGLVHQTYNGVLPQAPKRMPHEAYAEMLGRFEYIGMYAKRTPFSRVHADLLTADPEHCPWSPQDMVRWASQEMVRWAREEMEVGRALGMDDVQIKQLMVEHQRHAPTPAERANAAIGAIGPNFFEALS